MTIHELRCAVVKLLETDDNKENINLFNQGVINMDTKFTEGFLFGVAQCIANECSLDIAVSVLKAAGVTSNEIRETALNKYDYNMLKPIVDGDELD